MPLRVVVDTNVWISALINPQGPPAHVLTALKRNAFEPVLAVALLEELLEVARRPRLHRYRLKQPEVASLQNLTGHTLGKTVLRGLIGDDLGC